MVTWHLAPNKAYRQKEIYSLEQWTLYVALTLAPHKGERDSYFLPLANHLKLDIPKALTMGNTSSSRTESSLNSGSSKAEKSKFSNIMKEP